MGQPWVVGLCLLAPSFLNNDVYASKTHTLFQLGWQCIMKRVGCRRGRPNKPGPLLEVFIRSACMVGHTALCGRTRALTFQTHSTTVFLSLSLSLCSRIVWKVTLTTNDTHMKMVNVIWAVPCGTCYILSPLSPSQGRFQIKTAHASACTLGTHWSKFTVDFLPMECELRKYLCVFFNLPLSGIICHFSIIRPLWKYTGLYRHAERKTWLFNSYYKVVVWPVGHHLQHYC